MEKLKKKKQEKFISFFSFFQDSKFQTVRINGKKSFLFSFTLKISKLSFKRKSNFEAHKSIEKL